MASLIVALQRRSHAHQFTSELTRSERKCSTSHPAHRRPCRIAGSSRHRIIQRHLEGQEHGGPVTH